MKTKFQYSPLKRAMVMAFMMNPPELRAVMDSVDELSDDLKKLYTEKDGKFELTGIKGVQTDANVQRLEATLRKERENVKQFKEKLQAFGDYTPESIGELKDKMEELEITAKGKLNDEEINKIVESRLKSKTGPLERELDKLKKEKGELEGKVTEFTGKERKRTIDDAVRQAAVSVKVQEAAMEDVLLYGERLFDIDEAGKIITKDGVGITPGLDPTAWLQEVQGKKPHWFGVSQGGGAGGGGGGGFSKNPWTRENWNMTEQSRLYRENADKAKRMAEAAGTTIGGGQPVKK